MTVEELIKLLSNYKSDGIVSVLEGESVTNITSDWLQIIISEKPVSMGFIDMEHKLKNR